VFDEGLRPVTLNVRGKHTQRIRLAIIACAISLSEKLRWFIEQSFCADRFEEVEGHGRWRNSYQVFFKVSLLSATIFKLLLFLKLIEAFIDFHDPDYEADAAHGKTANRK
jgi:hypothetical protein